MKNNNVKKRLSSDAVMLDRYLSTYNRCKNRKKALEDRRQSLLAEFESPLKFKGMNGMPKGGGTSVGCAALSYELDDINTRIDEKIKELERTYVEISNTIDFLADNSTERAILEYKYIDSMSWNTICDKENLTRTPATQYWRKGLYELLKYAKVQQIVKDYAKKIDCEMEG